MCGSSSEESQQPWLTRMGSVRSCEVGREWWHVRDGLVSLGVSSVSGCKTWLLCDGWNTNMSAGERQDCRRLMEALLQKLFKMICNSWLDI